MAGPGPGQRAGRGSSWETDGHGVAERFILPLMVNTNESTVC
ncbi:MAG: hypothetical protein WBU92_07315 [Candidatus Dormiibacterota bacterium]